MNSLQQLGQFMEQNTFLFYALIAWSFVWKGIAMWKAAQLKNKPWFIAFIVINTFGLLEILYVYFFSKSSKKEVSQ